MSFPTILDVRSYIRANNPLVTSSQVTDGFIGSNLTASVSYIEQATNRFFSARPGITLTYSTEGRAVIELPGVQNVTAATWPAGVPLTLSETYWLLPDVQQSGVYTSIQLRPFIRTGGGPSWLASPEWFDRGLDLHRYPGDWDAGPYNMGGLPNDLVINCDGGYVAGTEPAAYDDAVLLLTAWKTLRPASLLSGVATTTDGLVVSLAGIPDEVASFVNDWSLELPQAVSV
jgi:hypothetical protein